MVNIESYKYHLNVAYIHGTKRACRGKQRYHSHQKATSIAAMMTKKTGANLEAYPCPFCMTWHVGRKMSRDERRGYDWRLPDGVIEEWKKIS